MIDLHMHTNHSDGLDTPNELLQKAENIGLKLISITDHDHALAYENLNHRMFSGDIIPGTEIATTFEGHTIEVLGYGVNTEVINKWYNNFYSEKKVITNEKKLFNRILKILDNLDVKYTDGLKMTKIERGISKPTIYYDLIKYEENKEKLPEDTFQSFKKFLRKGLANPNSPLFCNEGEFYPSLKEVISLIKKSGGLSFLAHLFVYEIENHFEFLDRLLEDVKLDGLECYHSDYTKKNIADMVKYAEKNGYYISGGSDYHADPIRKVNLGTGKGQFEISKKIMDNWINKVTYI